MPGVHAVRERPRRQLSPREQETVGIARAVRGADRVASSLVRAPFFAAALATLAAAGELRADELVATEAGDACSESYECRRNGRCAAEGEVCVARSQTACEASTACREDGVRCLLDADVGRCVSRLGRKVDPATTEKVAPPPGVAPYQPGNPTRDAGFGLTVLGSLGLGVGLVSSCLWELSPEGDTQDAFMIASLSGTLGGLAFVVPGVVLLHQPGHTPVYGAVGPGRLRITF